MIGSSQPRTLCRRSPGGPITPVARVTLAGMRPTFVTRRAAQLALVANAIRPAHGKLTAIPGFFAGWLTTELAPHLLTLTAADTAVHLARHGVRSPRDRIGLAMAGLGAAGLASFVRTSTQARTEVATALRSALGPDYDGGDGEPDSFPLPAEVAPWKHLTMPFRMHTPGVRRDRDIAYASGGKRFLLDVYRPDVPDLAGRPVLLQVHGGAWMIGNKDQQGLPLMQHMAQRGWVCVPINYPLSPAARWPDHLIAAKRAVAWIREHIGEYGGDPDYLAVTGGSAGGHLSALLALTANDSSLQPGFEDAQTGVDACVPHYGVYDFAASSGSPASKYRLNAVLAKYVVGKDPKEHRDDYVAASPLERVSDSAPPFFIIHGEKDTIVPVEEARDFSARLREVSPNPVAYAEIAGAQHAFDVFHSVRGAHVIHGVQQFLDWSYRHRHQRAEPRDRR